jgi:hypothetical protein
LFKERARSVQAISLFVDSVTLAVAYPARCCGCTTNRSLLREIDTFPALTMPFPAE